MLAFIQPNASVQDLRRLAADGSNTAAEFVEPIDKSLWQLADQEMFAVRPDLYLNIAINRCFACDLSMLESMPSVKRVSLWDKAPGRQFSTVPENLAIFARTKVAPMVRGLFPRKECDLVLALLEKSVVFLMPENIEEVIRRADLNIGRQVANVYLASIGAELLAERDSRTVVGISVETTCYVSLEYFTEDDPFADFVVHEAAHIFHNCKRKMVGLPHTRRREWLLPVHFFKRETFAYACEAYSRIREIAKRPADRQALLKEHKQNGAPTDERVDGNEYFEILAEAVSRRNGWKAILERCSVK